jgi:hypothetical protein
MLQLAIQGLGDVTTLSGVGITIPPGYLDESVEETWWEANKEDLDDDDNTYSLERKIDRKLEDLDNLFWETYYKLPLAIRLFLGGILIFGLLGAILPDFS